MCNFCNKRGHKKSNCQVNKTKDQAQEDQQLLQVNQVVVQEKDTKYHFMAAHVEPNLDYLAPSLEFLSQVFRVEVEELQKLNSTIKDNVLLKEDEANVQEELCFYKFEEPKEENLEFENRVEVKEAKNQEKC